MWIRWCKMHVSTSVLWNDVTYDFCGRANKSTRTAVTESLHTLNRYSLLQLCRAPWGPLLPFWRWLTSLLWNEPITHYFSESFLVQVLYCILQLVCVPLLLEAAWTLDLDGDEHFVFTMKAMVESTRMAWDLTMLEIAAKDRYEQSIRSIFYTVKTSTNFSLHPIRDPSRSAV